MTLNGSSDKLVTVAYETLDGSAVADSDYTSTAGMLRFEAGETNKTIAVQTIEDATAEESEAFTVQLSDPTGATVADGTATGTITDDDDPPGLSIDDAPPVREGEAAEFVVRLSAASGAAVTVSYRTMDGTAAAGFDYVATEGTLRFEAGETRNTIVVPTIEDAAAEETEGFTVQLSDPSGATVADGSGTGTITDDVQQRIGVVNDVVLPEVGRALAFSAVRCRIDQVLAGSAPRGRSTEPSARLAFAGSAARGGLTDPSAGRTFASESRSRRWAGAGAQSPTAGAGVRRLAVPDAIAGGRGRRGTFRGMVVPRLPEPGGRRPGRRDCLGRRGVELARGSGRADRPRPACRRVLFPVAGLV